MPDFANMTEEEQIAFAMQMSMQDSRKTTLLPLKMTFLTYFYRRSNHSTSQTPEERRSCYGC